MAESFAVSGLAAKRAELTGLIAHHQAAARRFAEDVAHIDAAIKILAPEFDLRTVRTKEYRVRCPQSRQRHCLRSRRKACLPITPQQGHETSPLSPQRKSLKIVNASASVICITLSTDNVRAFAERRKCWAMINLSIRHI